MFRLPLWLPLALTCSLRLSLALSGSYWISPCLSLALYGSLWLPLWLSLALTATLWHTLAPLAHYCSQTSRIQSLIGSQGRCSALSAAAMLTHFLPLWPMDHGRLRWAIFSCQRLNHDILFSKKLIPHLLKYASFPPQVKTVYVSAKKSECTSECEICRKK